MVTTFQLEISAVAHCYLSYFCQVNEEFSLLIYELIYTAMIIVCYSIALFISDQFSVSCVHILDNSKPQKCTAIILASTCMWCGYKITGLMLEHLLFKKLHNRNVVTLNLLPSAIPTPLHMNFPLLEAMLQVIF